MGGRHTAWWAAGAAGLLLLAAGAGRAQSAPADTVPPVIRRASDAMMAIMPFAAPDKSTPPDDAWEVLSDGFSRRVGESLARLPGTIVISADSAETLRSPGLDPAGFGRALGAQYVLAGALEPAPGGVRVIAALYDVAAGTRLWSSDDQADRMHLAPLAQTLALRIARTADVALLDDAARRSFYGHVNEPSSDDFSLRGLAVMNRSNTQESIAAARRHFQNALARDGANVDALAGLAHVHQRLATTPGWSPTPDADLAEGLSLAERALALDPHDAYAHFVRGILLSGSRRIDAADAEFQAALTVNYSFAPAHAFGGYNRIFLGHAEATLPAVTQALTISPRDPNIAIWCFFAGAAELALGHDEAAIGWLEKSAAANPVYTTAYVWLLAADGLTGRTADAARNLAELKRLARDFTLARFRAQWVDRSDDPTFRRQIERVVAGLKAGGVTD